jgi:DHA1 family tetracycline resistance protein-like MFS transporter
MAVENERRALATVFAVVFVDLLGFGILIPVIPLYARGFGANEFVASLLIATYSALQFVGAPVLGRLSDRRGRRPVLLVSLSGSVIAWTLFGVAWSLWILFLARAVAGLMGGNIATANAYIADVTDPDDRAKYLGLLGAAFGLGFVFGPAIGGVLSSAEVLSAARAVLPAAVPVTEFTLPSFGAAAITGLNLLAAVAFLPESRPPEALGEVEDRQSRTERLYDALTTRGLGVLVASFFLTSFAFSALESQFIFLTNDLFDYGTAENAVLLTYFGLLVAAVQGGLVDPVTDRFGEYRVALGGVALQAATIGLLPYAADAGDLVPTTGPLLPVVPVLPGGVLLLLLVVTPLSAGNGLANVSLNTLVSLNAGADEQGGAFGLTQSAGSLARTGGPALAGALYTVVDFHAPFVAAAGLLVPVGYLLWTSDGLVETGEDVEDEPATP